MTGDSRCPILLTASLTALLGATTAGACDPCPQNNTDGSASSPGTDPAYGRALQSWVEWQRQIYEDRKRAAEARAEALKRDRLDRQLYHPPVTEIWAAEPLNALLTNLQTLAANGTPLPEVEIDEAVLPHVHLTAGIGAGSAGVLKNDGVLAWPLVLRRREFAPLTVDVSNVVKRLVDDVKAGKLDADEYQRGRAAVDRVLTHVRARVGELSPADYIEAKRYLTDLATAVKTLSQPDAASHFNQDYAARGRTVKDLLELMTKKGLRFAPAAPTDKVAYLALHRALASCALAANTQMLFQ